MPWTSSLPAALIFDMDGVLVDSNPFHLQKWVAFLDKHRIRYNPDDLPDYVLGQRNDVAFRHFFGPGLREVDMARLNEELETEFRKGFRPHARPLPGLESLIRQCYQEGVPMAVASSAMSKNVEFIVDTLGFRKYFRCLLSGDEVSRPKPDPEIYLKAAEKLSVTPTTCVAFEDSLIGVEAAQRAGMRCVAIASTLSLDELKTRADLAVPGFQDLSLERIRRLFNG